MASHDDIIQLIQERFHNNLPHRLYFLDTHFVHTGTTPKVTYVNRNLICFKEVHAKQLTYKFWLKLHKQTINQFPVPTKARQFTN